jgi:hypothetical protein
MCVFLCSYASWKLLLLYGFPVLIGPHAALQEVKEATQQG